MKFNKKTLAESITSELSGNKHFTSGKKQNVVITEAQLERLMSSNNEDNKKVVTETIEDVIKEAYVLINQCIISEGIDSLDMGNYTLNEQGQYNRDPGVAAGEGLEVVIDGIKKAYEMVKDSDMRKKIENTLVKLNNFMTTTAELMQSGAPGGHAVRHTDKITDKVPYPELDEEVSEGAKPDFLDLDGDGDKKESMKKASKDAKKEEVDEEMGYDEEIKEGDMCEQCGEVHEGGCGHAPAEDDDMFDSMEDDGDYFDDEEDGFNQDKFEFGGFGMSESIKKSDKALIAEDIKKMKQIINPISKI
tara:strand:+ start:188 stop:1099 length:912 start_codon:yes stop_codon:yes gene_type:complete